MTTHWDSIADCLRAEIAEYGGLLHLFEETQRCLFERDAEGVLRFSQEIEHVTRTLGNCRIQREKTVADFALANDRPANTTLRSMLPLVEPDAQPLIEALINEVNTLLHRVRRISRHNHMLLSRTVQMHQETLQQLRPHSFTKTYTPAGRVSVAAAFPSSTLRIAG
jgi:flagellar biosynthesis/type III secretory pathway chaperone